MLLMLVIGFIFKTSILTSIVITTAILVWWYLQIAFSKNLQQIKIHKKSLKIEMDFIGAFVAEKK
jgi:hypothetical protein